MMQDSKNDQATVVASETAWQGRLWSMKNDQVRLPGASGEVNRQYLEHPGAVAIVALNDEDEILLIEQYRHPVRARLWEIPAGLLDVAGEDYLTAAQRELAEEADLVASQWAVLVDIFMSPGCTTESLRVYLARGVSASETAFQRTDEEADIVARWVPLSEAQQMVFRGELHSPSAVTGILTAAAAKATDYRDLRPTDAPWMR